MMEKPADTFKCYLVSWDETYRLAKTLALKIKFPLPIDIYGKNVLIVDDVVDTGDTFTVTMDYVKGKNPSEIKSAVLHYKIRSTFVPDYWAEMQDEWKWIMYPWAVYEDLTGFIKRVLTKPMTHGEIRKALKSKFDIKISKKDFLEMLNDMQATGEIQKIKKGALVKKSVDFQSTR
jgi:hypoxanthine phosphoribosyltransferase